MARTHTGHTKLSPLQGCLINADANAISNAVSASIYKSCSDLGLSVLDTVLLHRATHRWDWGGAAWAKLLDFVEEGKIRRLGLSVQSPAELVRVLDDPDVLHIQMPFNVVDHRWQDLEGHIRAVKSKRDLHIHVRSPLLQGLIASDDDNHWAYAHVADKTRVTEWLDHMVIEEGRESRVDLALAFLRSQDWIDGIVMGVDNQDQLRANLATFQTPKLSDAAVDNLRSAWPLVKPNVLNPALWGQKKIAT